MAASTASASRIHGHRGEDEGVAADTGDPGIEGLIDAELALGTCVDVDVVVVVVLGAEVVVVVGTDVRVVVGADVVVGVLLAVLEGLAVCVALGVRDPKLGTVIVRETLGRLVPPPHEHARTRIAEATVIGVARFTRATPRSQSVSSRRCREAHLAFDHRDYPPTMVYLVAVVAGLLFRATDHYLGALAMGSVLGDVELDRERDVGSVAHPPIRRGGDAGPTPWRDRARTGPDAVRAPRLLRDVEQPDGEHPAPGLRSRRAPTSEFQHISEPPRRDEPDLRPRSWKIAFSATTSRASAG